ncbi:MAG TPA: PAS domain S-box protein [Syntrophales bacterium]|jgi:PAS domain S-box-containing protein|nr:PAS domain S-box protein [Syntrophales bacterium]HQJ29948.1 PAS domain S-box protein [Syntrophales bacterium]
MHNLLVRQLKKAFGRVDGFEPVWQDFLHSVDEAYRQSDTDRQMLERALDLSSDELLQANSELRAIFQTLPDVYLRLAADGRILDFKGGAEETGLFTIPNPVGRVIATVINPELSAGCEEFLARVLVGRQAGAHECSRRTDEGVCDYEVRGVPFLADQAIVVVRDITARKQAERELQREAREKAVILDSMSEIVVYIDGRYNVVWANKAMYDAFSFSPSAYVGTKCFHIHKRRQPCSFCPAVKAMETGQPQIHERLFSYGKHWILRGFPVRNEQGEIIGAVEIVTDVTESRNAEEALRQSEERYRLLVENASLSIVIVQDMVIKYANPRTSEAIGYSNEELLNSPVIKFVHPEDLPMIYDISQRRLRGEAVPPSYVVRLVKKDGEVIWAEFSGVSLAWQGKPATMSFIRDVTDRKNLEERLLQIRNLETIGTLAGGIAHDFNNLLMGIQGYTSLMLLHTPPGHPHYQKLKSIEKQVQSGAELTRQLLGFARGGKYEVQATDLNEFIASNSELFGRTKKEITIHRSFAVDLWPVMIDRGQFEQVFLNLYVNAWQAMPGQGDLYLETQNVTIGEREVRADEVPPGRYVQVSVRDTGMGMDEKTRRRIFDPFFTTKGMKHGSGLGLASAYGIIANHGGFITVESERGKGATFRILLPAAEKAPPALKGDPDAVMPDSPENRS